jgi:4-amino-4-deoxychorismate lyase
MCLLIESVKVRNRQLFNIEAHNRRVADSRRIHFGSDDILDLRDVISLPDDLEHGLYKCRIVYGRNVHSVEFQLYDPKIVRTLRLVHDDSIRYDHKYSDRTCFDMLLRNSNADDILVVQKGLITDASFANVVLHDGKEWVTPAHPLLNGTKRQMLLQSGTIRAMEINYRDLHRYTHAALINAMVDLHGTPLIPVANIFA